MIQCRKCFPLGYKSWTLFLRFPRKHTGFPSYSTYTGILQRNICTCFVNQWKYFRTVNCPLDTTRIRYLYVTCSVTYFMQPHTHCIRNKKNALSLDKVRSEGDFMVIGYWSLAVTLTIEWHRMYGTIVLTWWCSVYQLQCFHSACLYTCNKLLPVQPEFAHIHWGHFQTKQSKQIN